MTVGDFSKFSGDSQGMPFLDRFSVILAGFLISDYNGFFNVL